MLHKTSNLPDLQRRAHAPDEGGDSIKGLQLQGEKSDEHETAVEFPLSTHRLKASTASTAGTVQRMRSTDDATATATDDATATATDDVTVSRADLLFIRS